MSRQRGFDPRSGRFALYAPGAEFVELIFRAHPEGPEQLAVAMRPARDEADVFLAWCGAVRPYYRYRVHWPWGSAELPDPWSKAVARRRAPGNEAWSVCQPESPPQRRPAGCPIDPDRVALLEVHIRDMTWHHSAGCVHPGTYLGMVERHPAAIGGLHHALGLGVDGVELMPLASYPVDEGERVNHWGYMPSFMLAASERFSAAWEQTPEGGFVGVDADGTYHDPADELRAMVDALHAEGLSVVVDVVWNHVSLHDDNPLLRLDPGLLGQPGTFVRAPDGRRRSDSGCGNDLDADHPEMRALLRAAVERWVGDFGFDGLRLDLGALLSDAALRDLAAHARARAPDVWLSAEPWSMASYRPEPIAALGYAVWNDRYRNLWKGDEPSRPGLLFGATDFDGEQIVAALEGSTTALGGWLPGRRPSVSYLACHDGPTLADFVQRAIGAEPGRPVTPQAEAVLRLAAAVLACTRGPILLHAGQSFGRSRSDASGWVHNAYDRDDAASHLDWRQRAERRSLVAWTAQWLAVRRRWMTDAFGREVRRDVLWPATGGGVGIGIAHGPTAHVALLSFDDDGAEFVLPPRWSLVIAGPGVSLYGDDERSVVRLPGLGAVFALGPDVTLQKADDWR